MSIGIDLTGKIVLISGGSSGIGLGIAQRFLAAGAVVHVTGTRAAADDYEHADELRALTYHQVDVRDDSAVQELVISLGCLDVLVCCAGSVAYGGKEFDMATFREIIDINLNGVMSFCTASHDLLKESEAGSVVIIGSTSSFIATPGQPAYSSSKGGLVTMTKSLAEAWARDGIRVNGVAPGFVATKLTARSHEDKNVYEATLKRIPLRRWGEAQEIGDAVVFFASPMAAYITGQMLLVDGGITLM
jgi:3-oxoacyl-[acyl-carrier protein] reductase